MKDVDYNTMHGGPGEGVSLTYQHRRDVAELRKSGQH